MRNRQKTTITVLLCGLALCGSRAQDVPPTTTLNDPGRNTKPAPRKTERALNSDDRLAVIASALDAKTPRVAEHDCSHLVHAIYERAGFPYTYASSDDLYDGVEGFHRVTRPQPADLVVWHGHVGIVIRPSRHVFFSFLTHGGPGTDDYKSQYWRGRGEPRFYRYVKNASCPGCTVARRGASE